MDNLHDLLGIRRMDKVLNAQIRELYGVTKEIDERIDYVLQWFNHIEKIGNDSITKGIYIREYRDLGITKDSERKVLESEYTLHSQVNNEKFHSVSKKQKKSIKKSSVWQNHCTSNSTLNLTINRYRVRVREYVIKSSLWVRKCRMGV